MEFEIMEPLLNAVELHKRHLIDPKNESIHIVSKFFFVLFEILQFVCVFTCDGILESVIHSANGFNEQSHDNGLSCNDKLCKLCAPSNAFFATIEISFPSSRRSLSDGNGAIKSDVSARRKLCVKLSTRSRDKCCNDAPETATIPL